MKKSSIVSTLALAAFFAASPVSFAQDAKPAEGSPRPGRTPEEQVKAMKESLNLSDEQTEKVKVVFAKHQEKIKALREDQSLSQEDRRTKMREIFQGIEADVNPILTPEQQTKWKEEREKRRAQRAGNQ